MDKCTSLYAFLANPTSYAELRLTNSKLTTSDRTKIAKVLIHNTAVKSLLLWGNLIADAGAREFAKMLRFNKTLKELYLDNNAITDEGALAIAQGIKYNSTLERFSITYNHISNEGVKAMQKYSTNIITNFDCQNVVNSNSYHNNQGGYSDNMLQSEQATNLENGDVACGAIIDSTMLSVLKNGSWLDFQAYLQVNKITEIKLGGGNIGPLGGFKLDKAINNSTMIEELVLFKNNLDTQGASYISNVIRNNNYLTEVDLRDNNVGARGIRYISKILNSATALKTLKLASNDIGDEGVESIRQGVNSSSSITQLDLRNNNISDKGAASICHLINTNKVVLSMNLDHNKIMDSGAALIAESLLNNDTLKYLYIRANKITLVGAKYFANNKDKVITVVDISYNNIYTYSGAEELCNTLNITYHAAKELAALEKQKLYDIIYKNSLSYEICSAAEELFNKKKYSETIQQSQQIIEVVKYMNSCTELITNVHISSNADDRGLINTILLGSQQSHKDSVINYLMNAHLYTDYSNQLKKFYSYSARYKEIIWDFPQLFVKDNHALNTYQAFCMSELYKACGMLKFIFVVNVNDSNNNLCEFVDLLDQLEGLLGDLNSILPNTILLFTANHNIENINIYSSFSDSIFKKLKQSQVVHFNTTTKQAFYNTGVPVALEKAIYSIPYNDTQSLAIKPNLLPNTKSFIQSNRDIFVNIIKEDFKLLIQCLEDIIRSPKEKVQLWKSLCGVTTTFYGLDTLSSLIQHIHKLIIYQTNADNHSKLSVSLEDKLKVIDCFDSLELTVGVLCVRECKKLLVETISPFVDAEQNVKNILYQAQTLVCEVNNTLKDISNEENVVFLGASGSGKSTVINYLLGNKLKGYTKGDRASLTGTQVKVELVEKTVNAPAIGASINSQTIIIKKYISTIGTYRGVIWDCPGFNDNRGEAVDISNALLVSDLLEKSHNVKVVLVVEINDIMHVRFQGFLALMEQVKYIFNDLNNIQHSTMLLVTKAPRFVGNKKIPYTLDGLKSDIKGQLSELNNKDELSHMIDFCHALIDNDRLSIFYQADKGILYNNEAIGIVNTISNISPTSHLTIIPGISTKTRAFLAGNTAIIIDMLRTITKELLSKLDSLVQNNDFMSYKHLEQQEIMLKKMSDKVQEVLHRPMSLAVFINKLKEFLIEAKVVNILDDTLKIQDLDSMKDIIVFASRIKQDISDLCISYILTDVDKKIYELGHVFANIKLNLMKKENKIAEENIRKMQEEEARAYQEGQKRFQQQQEELDTQKRLTQDILVERNKLLSEKIELLNKVNQLDNRYKTQVKIRDELTVALDKCVSKLKTLENNSRINESYLKSRNQELKEQIRQKEADTKDSSWCTVMFINEVVYSNPLLNESKFLSQFAKKYGSDYVNRLIDLTDVLGPELTYEILGSSDNPVDICAALLG